MQKNGNPFEERGASPLGWGLTFSIAAHVFICLCILVYVMVNHKKTAEIPVFELVTLEKPRLRPIQPKIKPPEPVAKPEPIKTTEAPKLTPKPIEKTLPKPEPKVVREEVVKEPQVTEVPQEIETSQELQIPADPRLSFWAKRVKQMVENLWKPPSGIDILQDSKVVVSFIVNRDGSVEEIQISVPTGNALLDELALRTIQRLGKVPPIPQNYPEDRLQVGYEFVYKAR